MAVSKRAAFGEEEVRLAAFCKALAHPARVAILEVLAAQGRCFCGEVVDELPLAQATVSQHLKALKEAGLIQGEVEGPRSCYCIDPDGLRVFQRSVQRLFSRLPSPEEKEDDTP